MEGNNNYVKRTFVLDLINEVNSSGGFKSYSNYSTMFDLVDDMPAADVQPVKHGHWIPKRGDWWLCSNCENNLIYSTSDRDRTEKQRYCSRCGARMDGDKNVRT